MLIDHYPVLGLRLTTPRLELRLPSPEELSSLADLAAEGIHDPAFMPFCVPWTDQPQAELARAVVQYHWKTLGESTPQEWSLHFTVFHDGVVVGTQDLNGRMFRVTREVSTGSWLGLRHQGKGIGTEMRAAVLQLAFVGLAAQWAVSDAYTHNPASLAVSRKLGYEPDGIARHVVRDEPAILQRLRLSRAGWERHRTVPVTIDGLEPCLAQLDCPGTTETA